MMYDGVVLLCEGMIGWLEDEQVGVPGRFSGPQGTDREE